MARDAAIVTTWGGGIAGRESKGLEVFLDSMTFWAKRAADGLCSNPEVFFAEDASGGMLIVRGKTDALREITESDEGRCADVQRGRERAGLHVADPTERGGGGA